MRTAGLATAELLAPRPASARVILDDLCYVQIVTAHRGGAYSTGDAMRCKPACNSDQVRGETGVQN
jgi:hypothetical protein